MASLTANVVRSTFTGVDASLLSGTMNNAVMPPTLGTSSMIFLGNVGTVSAPTFSFYNETTTGVYRPLANAIGFSCGGTETAQLNTQGLILKSCTKMIIIK